MADFTQNKIRTPDIQKRPESQCYARHQMFFAAPMEFTISIPTKTGHAQRVSAASKKEKEISPHLQFYTFFSMHYGGSDAEIVCSMYVTGSPFRSVGGLSKCLYQGLRLADLNVNVFGQSIIKRGLTRDSLITWLFLLPFLCMDFHPDSRGHGRSYDAWGIR